MPAQNAGPLAAMITARTASSASRSAMAMIAGSSCQAGGFMAFFFAGRFSQTQASGPSFCTR
jgi:hypothetical protein